jgi:hypothetical protein
LTNAEARLRRLTEEEMERLKEKERWMETEIEGLKERARAKEEERQEGVNREERMHRQCQAIKQQMDQCRKEQERMLIQVKGLITDKEKILLELARARDLQETETEKAKGLAERLEQAL